MKLSCALPQSGAWATPANQVRLAREAEDLGYHGLWTLQRLLYATRPQNDYPPLAGQPWPGYFENVADPIVSLAYVAGATQRIRLGTAVLLMPYYTPIVLAKMLATLDRVAGGRLDVGLGIGWSRDEYAAVGVPFTQRGKRGDEFLRCLKAIWTEEEVEFHGAFYHVPRAKVLPKPVQKPHPPLIIGGYGAAAIRRAATYGDGFVGGNFPLQRVAPLLAELRAATAAAGRDPATMRFIARGVFRVFDEPQGPDRRPLWGTLDEIREDIARYAEAGMTELFLEANLDPAIALDPDGERALHKTLAVLRALAPGR
jgi:probable F420-dependent oxidoreductase